MSTATVIDAQLVKTLREKTNAGLMDCKKALAETNGDLEAAVDVLRKKGTIKAGEKADREAKEGVIAQAILPGAKVGVLDDGGKELDRTVELLAKENRTDAVTAALSAWWATAKATATEDKPLVTDAELNGDRKAMSTTAVLPIVQAVLCWGRDPFHRSRPIC